MAFKEPAVSCKSCTWFPTWSWHFLLHLRLLCSKSALSVWICLTIYSYISCKATLCRPWRSIARYSCGLSYSSLSGSTSKGHSVLLRKFCLEALVRQGQSLQASHHENHLNWIISACEHSLRVEGIVLRKPDDHWHNMTKVSNSTRHSTILFLAGWCAP